MYHELYRPIGVPTAAQLVTRYDKMLQHGQCKEESTIKDRIVLDPEICHAKPVIKGTRVLVSTILGALAGGDTIKQVLEDYPNISRDDVHAALLTSAEPAQYP